MQIVSGARCDRATTQVLGPSTALRTKVASGIRWGFIVSIATQVGRIVFLVALMRLLGPWNYGIVGQAAVVIAVAQIFVTFGLAASIVQRPRLDQNEVGTAFWLNVAMGLLLAVLMVLGAPLLSTFFKTEELTAVLRVLSISFVLKGMSVVPTALLTRNMRFRSLGMVEITSTFISGVLGVGAAAMGAGYWALVIQTVSLEAIYLFLILCISGLPELAWSATAARRLWSFSSRVMGADLVNYVSDNSDKFLVARFLGPTSLGLYSLAFRVPQLTLGVLTQVGRVLLPTFARLQDDRERLARAYLDMTESVSLAVFPAMTLAILCAPIVVPAVLGEAWADAVVPLQLLAAMTIPYDLDFEHGPPHRRRREGRLGVSMVGRHGGRGARVVSGRAPVGDRRNGGVVPDHAQRAEPSSLRDHPAADPDLGPQIPSGLGAGLDLFRRAWCRVVAHGVLAPGRDERTGPGYGSVGDRRGSLCGRPQGRMARRLPSSTRLRSPSRTRRIDVSDYED